MMGETETGAAEQLLSAVRDLAASVGEPGIGRAERVTRSRRAAESARDVPQVLAGLDPYADGRHNRLSDAVLVAVGPVMRNEDGVMGREGQERSRSEEGRAAADRLMTGRELAGVRAQARAAGLGVKALGEKVVAPLSTDSPALAAWLDGFAAPPVGSSAVKAVVPMSWSGLPDAVIDPGASNPADGGLDAATLAGDEQDYTLVGWSTSRSAQVTSWVPGAQEELDRFGSAVVSIGLEAELIRRLAADAPAAADLEAAEVAVGAAWPTGADLVLCNAADRPKIVRAYAAAGLLAGDRPQVLATGGVREAGTAYVMASSGVYLEASTTEVYSEVDPGHLGTQIGWLRFGLASARAAGVVQKVEVA